MNLLSKVISCFVCVLLIGVLLCGIDSKSEKVAEKETVCLVTNLPAYIGKNNKILKQEYNGECIAQISGMGGAKLTYINTGIKILFEPFDGKVWQQEEEISQYEENPFIDELIIYRIDLIAQYDGDQIISQKSLKQLFDTEEIITYELINNKLPYAQTLEKYDNDLYVENNGELIKVTHDVYRTEYKYNNTSIKILYLDIDNELIAFNIVLQ